MVKLKMRGDRGHPWHVPFDIWKGAESMSATLMRAEGAEYNAIMAVDMDILKPNVMSTSLIYPQCTLSNVFSASRDRSRECVPSMFSEWMRNLLVESEDCLPCIKTVWSALIRRGSNLDILMASNLAYNFRSTLSREIGLKLWGVSELLPGFGKATTTADNISGGNMAEEAALLKRF